MCSMSWRFFKCHILGGFRIQQSDQFFDGDVAKRTALYCSLKEMRAWAETLRLIQAMYPTITSQVIIIIIIWEAYHPYPQLRNWIAKGCGYNTVKQKKCNATFWKPSSSTQIMTTKQRQKLKMFGFSKGRKNWKVWRKKPHGKGEN